MSSGHRTQGHSCVLFQSKNIDVLTTLPVDICGHVPTCPGHDICVSYLKKIGHVLKGHFHLSPTLNQLFSVRHYLSARTTGTVSTCTTMSQMSP
jgi:hypothetical protein